MDFKKNLSTVILVYTMVFHFNPVQAQERVPSDVASVVNMKLDEGQKKLSGLGYEICAASLLSKKQDWYNESDKICVTIKFDKKKQINEIALNPETSECQRKLEASRKVWEKYHDGQAPVSAAKIDAERKKLTQQGFKVSYWIDEISPGRCSEYWVNDNTRKTMLIVWEIQGNAWVMTNPTEYQYGKNPASPKK